ncbi:PAS domain-containing protein [Pyxidicoccus sp. MSG2]|uniref:PAS domain-containing protein n=1 Tax=Pyxidicoccus sp. MSG2 TaxID=2996790 RepID=UPI00226E26C0|nr:PAS domain-containing protein [Pyxidicoccus sp. MSG2]MCY1017427.1 PAS domain-containing protein [Pyxidicoccus sp. MSG2]
MTPCATPSCRLPDLLEARRQDILRRWELRVGEVLGEGSPPRVAWVRGPPGLVDSLVDLLRGAHVALDLERARAFGGRLGRERYQAGVDAGTLVREFGLLRDAILEVLEEAGWLPELSGLRMLNQALDVGLADAVAQYGREQERGLRATESTLLGILDHAPAAIYAKDTRGRYLFINHTFAQNLGKSRGDVVGHTDQEMLPPDLAEVCELSDRQVLATGQTLVTDEHQLQPDGPHIFQSVKFPLPDAAGGVAAICGISTDVTEVRRAGRERDEAREHLSRIITQLPIIIWASDAKGIITLCEGEGLRVVGVDGSQLVGRNIFEVYADRPDLIEATRRAQAGECFALELEMGGSWFLTRVSPVLGPDGGVASVAGVSLDITERHRAQEVLRQSEMRYRLATQATSDVIYDWELGTGHIEWSELAARQFRLQPHQSLDIDAWTRRIHPEDRERVSREMQAVIDDGDSHWADEYRFLRGDGTWAVISDRGQVIRDVAGRAVRMVGAMQDITERRAAELEAKRRAEFEQLLIGIVSHDLRNPISAITMATTTLLRKENLDEWQRKVIGRILSSAERATRMLRDVLDFTQARLGGGIPMQPRSLDLHELTRQVVDEVQLANPERRLVIECSGDGRGLWDPDRLAQVITNLVNNAIHHSMEQGPVRVRTHGTHRAVALAVHNLGPPIPSELRTRLFEPMKRAERKEARDSRGLGLGLFIVKHIVDAHGGGLRVRSNPHEGTTFLVRLPRLLGREVAAPDVPHASA